MTCCQVLHEDLYFCLPDVSFKTLAIFKQLVTFGISDIVGSDDFEAVKTFLPHMKLSKISSGSSAKSNIEDEIGEDGEDDQFQNLIENVNFDEPKRVDQIYLDGLQLISICSKSCENDCHKVVKSWPEKDISRLKEIFKSEKIILSKAKLMNHLVAQDDIGQLVSSYIVKGHEFCLDSFAAITGCTMYLVSKVLSDFHSGNRLYLHGNSGCMKNKSAATVSAICWLKAFSEAYGQFSPDENCTILSYWLNKQALFKMYQYETSGPHISQSSFYGMFKSTFGHHREDKSLPWIRISKYSTHSVCSICIALSGNQKQCKSERELKQALDLKNNHRMNFGLARRKVEELKQSAISFPSDNLFIQIGRAFKSTTRQDSISQLVLISVQAWDSKASFTDSTT